MNEIEKLKTEHARYKAALEKIVSQYLDSSDAYKFANKALNPPPVTLDELKAALVRYSKANPKYGGHSINFFEDGSGSIQDCVEDRVFSFRTLREAVDFLNR